MADRGKFIVIEGLDGAGTTSITLDLQAHFEALGEGIVAEREPYSEELTPTLQRFISGEFEDPGWRAMSLLFSADRLIHCKDIDAVLELGAHVVCDRYIGSTVAYQTAFAPDDEKEEAVELIQGPLAKDTLKPDMTIFLKADVEVCSSRRGKSRFVEDYYEGVEFQKKVFKTYNEWIRRGVKNGEMIIVIDANRDYETVLQDCLVCVNALLEGKI
jgi:dTMP kinase